MNKYFYSFCFLSKFKLLSLFSTEVAQCKKEIKDTRKKPALTKLTLAICPKEKPKKIKIKNVKIIFKIFKKPPETISQYLAKVLCDVLKRDFYILLLKPNTP